MKNFSNALVLSVAMLATVANAAKENKVNLVAAKLNVKEFNAEACFFGKNKAAFETALVNYLSGKTDGKEVAKYVAALTNVRAQINAQLTVKFSKEAYELLKKIDALIARITKDCRFRNAYRELAYKGNVCKLEKRNFRKIAVDAILNHNVVAAA